MSNMRFRPPAWLLANHDVVQVGYRGVDGSVVLNCPEVTGALRDGNGDVLSADSRATLGAAMRRCAERLQTEGVDLEGYTIPEVVADLEAARIKLGYERVNLLSQSYGTRVAQVYAHLHPNRVFRSVMIGVNPPGRFVWEPGTIDAQLVYYARLCTQDPGCGLRTRNLAETIRTIAHNMPRRWLVFPIDPGKVKVVSFAMLFSRSTAAMVFDAYLAAAAGDASGLVLMSLASNFVVPSLAVWGDFFTKGATADFDASRDYATEMNKPQSVLGSPLSFLFFDPLRGNWPIKMMPEELRRAHPSDVETLLLSGSVDFSTPAEFATDELLPHLSRGKQVIVKEAGHVTDLWGVRPEATRRLLTTFYDSGVADDSLFAYTPMSFRPRLGFPALFKIVLAAALILLAGGVFLVWRIVRR
jgi:pimeloyl-ACP methyl ester carboxylesterase